MDNFGVVLKLGDLRPYVFWGKRTMFVMSGTVESLTMLGLLGRKVGGIWAVSVRQS